MLMILKPLLLVGSIMCDGCTWAYNKVPGYGVFCYKAMTWFPWEGPVNTGFSYYQEDFLNALF